MCAKMLDDLNVILLNITHVKQELQIGRSSETPDDHVRPLITYIHKLTNFSYHDYHTLWNFWNRMEAGYYQSRPFPHHTVNRWRNELLNWRSELDAIGTTSPTPAIDAGIPFKTLEAIAELLASIILEMVNPVFGAEISLLTQRNMPQV